MAAVIAPDVLGAFRVCAQPDAVNVATRRQLETSRPCLAGADAANLDLLDPAARLCETDQVLGGAALIEELQR